VPRDERQDIYRYIRTDLALLRAAPNREGKFGASAHRFEVRPPLAEAQVLAFEAKYRIVLPAEYRGFLLHVGNGGASPDFGMPGLGEALNGMVSEPWRESEVGDPSVPFPHPGPWNALQGWPTPDPERLTDRGYEDDFRDLLRPYEEAYFSPRQVDGTVPLCEMGCGYRTWLVVNGPEAGNIWDDLRADREGLRPRQTRHKQRVSFLEWYLNWLRAAKRLITLHGHV
jgi:hypothetical protein